MTVRRLPIHDEELTSLALRPDGRRIAIQPADVRGRYKSARNVVLFAFIGFWAALPWISIHGHPAVFLDIERRAFYLFGATFNAQDAPLLFFLVSGLGFGLLYTTTLLGRAWCGWACPQTVFIEGVYRRVERLIEGPSEKRLRRNAGPWTLDKVVRKGLTQTAYVILSVLIAHVFLAYFVSLPKAFEMVRSSPSLHSEAFAWVIGLTALFYVNFSWFREQFCVVLCPYGRLQSVLLDKQSLVIGYDVARGEPRGKKDTPGAGACVDCKRCIAVCPTGIDIRKGNQLECIACTACIDACDDVMDRVGRARGLIRYDSFEGLAGRARKIVRPRLIFYTVLLLIGATVAAVTLSRRTDFEAKLLRLQGAPYTLEGADVRNSFQLHIVNKLAETQRFEIEVEPVPGMRAVLPVKSVSVGPMGSERVPVFLTIPRDTLHGAIPLQVDVRQVDKQAPVTIVKGTFLGPS